MSELTLNEAKKLAEAQQAQELLDRAAAGESDSPASALSLTPREAKRAQEVQELQKLLDKIRAKANKGISEQVEKRKRAEAAQKKRLLGSIPANQEQVVEPSPRMNATRARVLEALKRSAASQVGSRFDPRMGSVSESEFLNLVPDRGVAPRQRKVRLPDGRLIPFKEPTPARIAAKARRAERVYERSLPRFDRFAYRFINKGGYKKGLAGLAALVGGALIGKALAPVGKTRSQSEVNEEFRQSQLEQKARGDMLDMMGRQEYKASLQDSINQNLARLQSEAPDIYLRMSAGRVLPQGAIVIGGAPRTDLLNQLGLAMANGQFGQ